MPARRLAGPPGCWQEKPWLRGRNQQSPRRPAPHPTGDAMQGARTRPSEASFWRSTWTGDSGEESAGGAVPHRRLTIWETSRGSGRDLERIDDRLLLRQPLGGCSGVIVRLDQLPDAADVEHPHVPALAGALGVDVHVHGPVV